MGPQTFDRLKRLYWLIKSDREDLIARKLLGRAHGTMRPYMTDEMLSKIDPDRLRFKRALKAELEQAASGDTLSEMDIYRPSQSYLSDVKNALFQLLSAPQSLLISAMSSVGRLVTHAVGTKPTAKDIEWQKRFDSSV